MRVWCLAVVVAAVACTKEPTPRVPMPADVFGVLRVPSLDGTLQDALAYASAVVPADDPEARAKLADFDALMSTGAIDRRRPLFLVLLSPPPGSDEPGLAVVFGTAKGGKVDALLGPGEKVRTAGSWTVLGDSHVVDRVAPWALSSLARGPAPAKLAFSLYPAAIEKRWGEELRAVVDGPGVMLSEAALAVLTQTLRVDATIDLTADLAIIDVAVDARPGSILAALFAAQRPATFAMLERLPMSRCMAMMAGRLALGPLAPRVRAALDGLIAAHFGPFAPASHGLLAELWSADVGEYAGMATYDSHAFNTLNVADVATLRRTLDELGTAMADYRGPGGQRVYVEASPAHAGVPVNVVKVATPDVRSGVPVGSWAAWDDVIAAVTPDEDGALLRATIDASRAPRPLGQKLVAVLDAARRRGDSLVQYYDVFPERDDAVILGMGVRDKTGYVWLNLPAVQLARMGRMGAGGAGDE